MKIQMIAEKIRAVMAKRDLNQAEVAKEVGLTATAINRILHGAHKWLKPDNEVKVFAWLRRNGQKIDEALPISPNYRPVKIYGLAQACTLANPPCDIMPTVHDSDLPEILWPANGHHVAAFKVEGDSMAPKLLDGYTVICDCDAEILNGQIVVAKFDGVAVIKRYRRVGDTILLTSDNPAAGKDYEIHASQMDWMIKVIGFQGAI